MLTAKSEVAAYELDKILQLDMVPPSVERVIEGQKGALQLWVHGCKVYEDVGKEIPQTVSVSWSHQLSRAKMFDNLIGNTEKRRGSRSVLDGVSSYKRCQVV